MHFLHEGGDSDAPRPRPRGQMTWMEMCFEDVGAHFGFKALVTDNESGSLDSLRLALTWRLVLDFLLGHLCFGPWVVAFWRGAWDAAVFYSEKVFQVQKLHFRSPENKKWIAPF